MKNWIKKTEDFIEKYQLFFLMLEMTAIFFMITYICRNKAVDWDEAYTFRMITKNSFFEMIEETALDVHPPLYYLLLWAFSQIFGTSFFTLKIFSVLFTVLTMFLGVVYVRKDWGWKCACIFLLVVGLGPQFLFYSVNIRMYSMELFFVTWCALSAYRILNHARGIDWVLFVVSALCGVYTHYFAAVPLAFIYGYLLVGLFLLRRKSCTQFFMACVVTVVAYLPWLSVVFQTFERGGISEGIDGKTIDFKDLCEWAFTTNIEWSAWMPVILFALAIIVYFATWKNNNIQDRLFLAMCALNLIFTYVVSRLIVSMNEHFYDNRYVYGALGLFWLFLSITYSKQGNGVFYAYGLWLTVMVLSSFVVQKAKELGTVDYMNATYELIEPLRSEEKVIYDYVTYDVLYGAHLPEQNFLFIEDVDFDKLDKNYIYMIAWSGNWFSPETVEKYHIEREIVGNMRFEEGVAGVLLYKITFVK